MEKLVVIRTIAAMQNLMSYIEDKNFIAYDIETTGVAKDSEIIGFSVCAEEAIGYYVVISEWNAVQQKLDYLETKDLVKEFISKLKGKSLLMHNGIFDCWLTETSTGISLIEDLHTDTMILAHIVDENRPVGLKELGVGLFGESAKEEQAVMKESVTKNGGILTKSQYELYKADSELIARYGAKDAILTLKVFWVLIEQLYEQKLDTFFYEESMPLLRGPTYDLNTTGLRVDVDQLQRLKGTLEAECMEDKAFIYKEIADIVADKYPGTNKGNTFNIGAPQQLSWLVFEKLGNEFNLLTDNGKAVTNALGLKIPYTIKAKCEWAKQIEAHKGYVWQEKSINPKTGKATLPKKVGDSWIYMACGKESLLKASKRYKWVEALLRHNKNKKLLNTYVEGIQEKLQYGIIRPSFLQHGTTSGRYSSRNPNFQNLPRDDKRIKACIVSRPGKVFVGADHAQLEPRVFASISQDETLMSCFARGEDFYSVVGAPIFGKEEYSMIKDDPNSFAKKFPQLRDRSKVVALATPYGRTAMQQASVMGITKEESQQLIDKYFSAYPKVELMMLKAHEDAKQHGVVYSIYGRPRRIPEAKNIARRYGRNVSHAELPYEARTLLNLSMNHTVQSAGASIVNRAAIWLHSKIKELANIDSVWNEVKLVLQVHDQLVLEGPEAIKHEMSAILKIAMEDTTVLPGVDLMAEPFISNNLADQK